MRAGELDRFIVIEQPTDARGAAGGTVQTWTSFAGVWAKKIDVGGKEEFSSDQVDARVDTIWRIRWLAGVTTKMRVSYGGQRWDIQHIAELGRREGMDLRALIRQA